MKLMQWYSRQKRRLKEVGDKVSADDKAKVQTEIDNLKALLERTNIDNMSDTDVDEIKAAKERLMESAQGVFTKMYEAAGAAGQNAGPNPSQGANTAIRQMMWLTQIIKKCNIKQSWYNQRQIKRLLRLRQLGWRRSVLFRYVIKEGDWIWQRRKEIIMRSWVCQSRPQMTN